MTDTQALIDGIMNGTVSVTTNRAPRTGYTEAPAVGTPGIVPGATTTSHPSNVGTAGDAVNDVMSRPHTLLEGATAFLGRVFSGQTTLEQEAQASSNYAVTGNANTDAASIFDPMRWLAGGAGIALLIGGIIISVHGKGEV